MAKTLPEIYAQARADHGPKDFLVFEESRLTYSETYDRAAAVARQLIDRFGVRKGDRVAIGMRNFPEWVIAFMAITSIGAISVSAGDDSRTTICNAAVCHATGDATASDATSGISTRHANASSATRGSAATTRHAAAISHARTTSCRTAPLSPARHAGSTSRAASRRSTASPAAATGGGPPQSGISRGESRR